MKADVDDIRAGEVPAKVVAFGTRQRARDALGRLMRWAVTFGFSSLTRRIVFLNLTGLAALVAGILYLSEFRAGLIEARIQSLRTQGEIMAGAIAASATADINAVRIDPERLIEQQAGDAYEDPASALDFPINPERVAPLLRRLVSPTQTRARIYDREGILVIDSRQLTGRDILRLDLPPPAEKADWIERIWGELKRWTTRGSWPFYKDLPPNLGKGYPEVVQALAGAKTHVVRMNDRGEVIVSVAVPIQRFRSVAGALLLNTQGGEIDDLVEQERLVVARVFLVSALVMVVVSIFMAGTIAGPVRKLADAAERVRRRAKGRVEIPDFSERPDEIGHLSGALRDMTDALYRRIEAIESFAADVAHELKNPLTSLRSAVETLPLARTEESRARLLAVIQHDVRRLDRLISDISDASRLDAELQRHETAPVDLHRLLTTVVAVANEVRRDDGVRVQLAFADTTAAAVSPRRFTVSGHDSRLGQVVHNLLDNARSFSPEHGTVRITCRRLREEIEIAVEDDGPGIRPDALERVFERFYTDRPEQGFGQNSGLGLSISKQIVEAHGGRIRAENRTGRGEDGAAGVAGARFVVRLPAG